MEKQRENKDKDKYILKSTNSETSSTKMLISFFWMLMTFFAIYLSFKCNKGFDITGFLGACCCSPIYIAYKLAIGECFSQNLEK
jgi:hypothetical protein